MASISDHLVQAERHLAALERAAHPDRLGLARLHLDLARARMKQERITWLTGQLTGLADEIRAAITRCTCFPDGRELHQIGCPDNDEGPADATAEPAP